MGIRQIRKMDDPALRRKAVPVKNVDEAVEKILSDMVETMHDAGGLGLAAPQVGIPKQIIVAYDGQEEVIQLVNPQLVETSGRALDIEGCLSIPGVYGEVPRAYRVVVEGLNEEGKIVQLEAEEMLARVLQHELDHLHGVLFTDKALQVMDSQEMKGDE